MPFPDPFAWGVASAAFQVEGSPEHDGRGRCIWDDFCELDGTTFQGHTGAVACDSYQRMDEDLDLLSALGVNAYRFSISWPRLFPSGTGARNERGFAYYDRLIDALIARGIEPWVTLYHWDLPSALHQQGGWLSPDSPTWFEGYTRAVVERFGDRVSNWITLNEPQIFIGLGYRTGTHAPGLALSRREVLSAVHHALLAHGAAVRTIREHAALTPSIGFASAGNPHVPATDAHEDVEAAYNATFSVPEDDWTHSFAWYTDPMLLGAYPEEALARFGRDAPPHTQRDMDLINQPIDFIGMNIYGARVISAAHGERTDRIVERPGFPMTMFRWPVVPEALEHAPAFMARRYGRPVVVTENGLASMDWVHADGAVHDTGRIDFLTRHLAHLRRAVERGVDIRGYFHWSIMDNFEWAEGYALRFGLVHMDYETMRRLPKDSFHWYRTIIETGGACVPADQNPIR